MILDRNKEPEPQPFIEEVAVEVKKVIGKKKKGKSKKGKGKK